ncbi:ATP-binding protein [Niallia sp. XMNu-256]|uniref:ATP-binding protein n=1 Tax=Niallia sp. XMNu-256 TaxID=3082444 RepID=UPI0030D3C834
MKKTGQVSAFIIVIIFTFFHIFPFKGISLWNFIISLTIVTTIAWMIGRQYDKIKFYMVRMNESEKNYRQLIDTMPNAILIYYKERILYVNNSAISLLGAVDQEQILGQSVYRFIHPNYREKAKERLSKLRKKHEVTNHADQKVVRLDNKTIYLEVSSRLINYEGKEAILSVFEDVTHKKEETEGLLQKSDKLAVVGQMAAGIAHEIRNPLTSIRGFIQLFESKYKDDQPYFQLVLSELDRINLIVGEFLVLAKPTAVEFKEKEVNNLIKEVVTLINTQAIMNNIQISVEYEQNSPIIVCEESQLKQVFINLLKNAIEAMPNGGLIEVRVKEQTKGSVSIYISDQGVGIPEGRIPKLGEPFYTTKEKGTGLGLMISYKIIESHNGEINISSEINKGTTIEVTLPTKT